MSSEFIPEKIYKTDEELGNDICAHFGCPAVNGLDQDGEPYCYGCTNQEELMDKYYHLILGEEGNFEYIMENLFPKADVNDSKNN